MQILRKLFDNNRQWAQSITLRNPDFFKNLSRQQSPEYLWIGCSDSRVPANQIVGLLPGELFVHRNIANMVVHTDFNSLSVIQYAVDALKVKHVIVCGHYGCGGVRAALEGGRHGLVDNWLRHIQDVSDKYASALGKIADPSGRSDRLSEFNVVEQVVNVCNTSSVQDAWFRGQPLSVHGWIYDIRDGLLQDLNICITRKDDILPVYRSAASQLADKKALH